MAANNDNKSNTNPPAPKGDAAESTEPTVLATAKRNGKTVRVLTDGVRTWKETK